MRRKHNFFAAQFFDGGFRRLQNHGAQLLMAVVFSDGHSTDVVGAVFFRREKAAGAYRAITFPIDHMVGGLVDFIKFVFKTLFMNKDIFPQLTRFGGQCGIDSNHPIAPLRL